MKDSHCKILGLFERLFFQNSVESALFKWRLPTIVLGVKYEPLSLSRESLGQQFLNTVILLAVPE